MLSPKELLRDDIAKLSISYETIVRGQDESIASLSKIPGKEGWLYREVDLDARHALCGTDGSFLKVWASLHDGRLLFSSFQSNNASVLDLFNKKKKSRLARGSAADNTSPQSSYISNMVGSFFSQRGAGDATSSRSGSAVGGKDKLKGGQCGKRCFGYLDLLANSGCQLKVLSSEFLITGRNRDGQTKHDRLFGFQLCEGDFSIVFATATEKERRDWLSKIREALNGTVHELPHSSLYIPLPARGALTGPAPDKIVADRGQAYAKSAAVDAVAFPYQEGFLVKTSYATASAETRKAVAAGDDGDAGSESGDFPEDGGADSAAALQGRRFSGIGGASPKKLWKGLKSKAGVARRRWFVLEAGHLRYFNKEQRDSEGRSGKEVTSPASGKRDTATASGIASGGDAEEGSMLNLIGAAVRRDSDKTQGGGRTLRLLLANGKSLRLEAASVEEAVEWVECLQDTISLLQQYSFLQEEDAAQPSTSFSAVGSESPLRRMNIHDLFDVDADQKDDEVDEIETRDDGVEGENVSERQRQNFTQQHSQRVKPSVRSHSLDGEHQHAAALPLSRGKSDNFSLSSKARSGSVAFELGARARGSVNKSSQTADMIKTCLAQNFLIRAAILDGDAGSEQSALQPLVDIIRERIAVPGEVIMWQGTSGDDYFVLEKGLCDVIKDGKKIALIQAGSGFGELALLNNSTRQATIRVGTCSRLWRLTRSQFRHVAATVEARKISEKVDFLRTIDIFQQLVPSVLTQIAEVMVLKSYQAGEKIIRQGDAGDSYYMILSGRVAVSQKKGLTGSSVELARLGPSKGFGELALFKDAPRAATVTATTAVSCWTVDRKNFLDLVGSMDDVVQESLGLKMLQQVKLLQPLSTQQLRAIARRLETVEYQEGETIIKQGDVGDKFFMISAGEVGVQVNHVQVATLESGSFFGEMSLLTNERRSATVVALRDCQCLVLSRADFVELLGPLDQLIQAEAQRRREQQHLTQLAQESSSRRSSFMGSLRRMSGALFASTSNDASEVDPADGMKDGSGSSNAEGSDMIDKVFAMSLPRSTLFMQTNAAFRDDFEQFIKLKRIGTGTFSSVYLVRHGQTGKLYAMKRQHKQRLFETNHEKRCSYLERNLLLMLADTQIVPLLYATLQDARSIYFIQQFVPGPDLWTFLYGKVRTSSGFKGNSAAGSKKLKRFASGMSNRLLGKPTSCMSQGLTLAQCQFYAANILTALCHIHEKEIVYRNLKPENMIIDSGGYLKVVDFGSSTRLRADSKAYTLCGAAEYCAPEMILGRGHDFAVDFWGFGVFLFELMYCTTPFAASNVAQVFQNIIESEEWFRPLLQAGRSAGASVQWGASVSDVAQSTISGSPDASSSNTHSPRIRKRAISFSSASSPLPSSPSQRAAGDKSNPTPRVSRLMPYLDAVSIDSSTRTLILSLLAFKPNTRLGMLRDGIGDIWRSPFFKDTSREIVERRSASAPFIPEFDEDDIHGDDDVEDFLDVFEDSDDYPVYLGDYDYSYL